MSLTLYYHPLSSYCQKVLIALYEAGTVFTGEIIDLGNETHRAVLGAHWPLCKFPVVHDAAHGRSVPESSTIIEYLDHYYPGATRLVPAEWERAIDVRLWDRIFDNYVQTPMQQIVVHKLTNSNADTSAHRSLLESSYRVIDAQLATRVWAAGDTFSLADCAAAPALFYATTLQAIPSALGALHEYFERLMTRASVLRTLDDARPYFPLYPFADAIPLRFR